MVKLKRLFVHDSAAPSRVSGPFVCCFVHRYIFPSELALRWLPPSLIAVGV